MFKIKNLTKDSRKFRIHKVGTSFFIRPGEELVIPYKPIVINPNIFKIIKFDEVEDKKEQRTVEKKLTKYKEDKK